MSPLLLTGRVERGEGIATGLGCPTANLAVEQGVIIPALGVYVAETILEGATFPSLVCVNDGRTGNNLKLEVHLIDICRDLSGKLLSVRLISKMRDLIPWESAEQMTALISKDLETARAWFAHSGS
ncbi:MAG: riboflavin kinase [Candidatus Uhrbacteria bacterium]